MQVAGGVPFANGEATCARHPKAAGEGGEKERERDENQNDAASVKDVDYSPFYVGVWVCWCVKDSEIRIALYRYVYILLRLTGAIGVISSRKTTPPRAPLCDHTMARLDGMVDGMMA